MIFEFSGPSPFENPAYATGHEINKMKISKAEPASIEELKERTVFFESFKLIYENPKVMQESNDKGLNILVHGVKEDSDNA